MAISEGDILQSEQTVPSSFWGKVWTVFKAVAQFIPGISYFVRKADDITKAVNSIREGDYPMAAAHVGGCDESLTIIRDNSIGIGEQGARLATTIGSGVIESVSEHVPGGKFAQNVAEYWLEKGAIHGGRAIDSARIKSTLTRTLGQMSDKEWQSLRDSIDSDKDGHIDQEEFKNALGVLDKNSDGKVTNDDINALGGRIGAIKAIKAMNESYDY